MITQNEIEKELEAKKLNEAFEELRKWNKKISEKKEEDDDKKEIKGYIIIDKTTEYELQETIETFFKLNLGWKLQGGVSCYVLNNTPHYVQAIVQEDNIND